MTRIIANQDLHCKNYFNQKAASTPKKLHSSDIPFLKVVRWFQTRAKNNKCYLTKEEWPIWLERFDGKKLSYSAIKRKRRKLEQLGHLDSYYENGNRNKEKTILINDSGLRAIHEFEKLSTAQPKQYKNAPSNPEKRSLEKQKTPPPLRTLINKDKKRPEFSIFKPQEPEVSYTQEQRIAILAMQRELRKNIMGIRL